MLINILIKYGQLGVEAIKQAVGKISATGETAHSVHFKVQAQGAITTLTIYGRKFFKAIETGRGPRKTTKDSGFKDYMMKYMRAKGIGSGLSPKKFEQLAKFLVLKINKEGDKTFKQGGRLVYTPVLEKLKKEVVKAVSKEQTKVYTNIFIDGFKHN
jgi:hypothetical protein